MPYPQSVLVPDTMKDFHIILDEVSCEGHRCGICWRRQQISKDHEAGVKVTLDGMGNSQQPWGQTQEASKLRQRTQVPVIWRMYVCTHIYGQQLLPFCVAEFDLTQGGSERSSVKNTRARFYCFCFWLIYYRSFQTIKSRLLECNESLCTHHPASVFNKWPIFLC